MIHPDEIFPLGIGTYRIDQAERADAIGGLRYALERGENYLSTGFSYGEGVIQTVSELLLTVDRERLFLCVYAEPDLRAPEQVRQQLEAYLRRFGTDYVDCYQIHNPYETPLSLEEIYPEMEKLQREGKVRFLGGSNLSPTAWKTCGEKWGLRFFEGLYNFECRNYEEAGVLKACRDRGVRFVCYQPLRRNRTAQKQYPLLVELAEKYGCSQNQVILSWLMRWKGLQVLVKSLTPRNIDANLASLELALDPEDCRRMDAFCCPACQAIPVDWDHSGTGVPIHLLANQF